MRVASAVLFSALSLLVAGCGIETSTGGSPVAMGAMSGIVHGGPNPVKFSTITLWETVTAGIPHAVGGTAGSSGYGSQAQILASTTSDGFGAFTFNGGPSYTCDPGEYAYLTSTGGYTGSNTANNNSVEVAVIGSCSQLSSATSIYISEVSTVAAAYALGNFISEDPSFLGGGLQRVYIGAPASNNAATPACTGTGSSMTCTAAGLAHGFQNALELVDSVRYSGSPTGQTNAVPAINGAVVNSNGVIPQALINFIGNVMQSCVNSTGGTGGATPCGKLFTDTTVGSNVPSDTLQAAMNIAKNPTNNVFAIASLATPSSFFSPSLNSAPTDFSLAVTYDGENGTTFGATQYVDLDPADNVYTVATTASTSSDVGGLSSYGAPLFLTTPNTSYFNENVIVADTLGNVWTANTAASGAVLEYSATSGGLEQTISATSPFGLAVDHSNNVYFVQQGSGTTVQYIPQGASAAQGTTLNGGAGPNISGVPSLIAIDSSHNLYANETSAASTKLFSEELVQLGPASCTPPDYCGYLGAPTGSTTTYGATYTTLFDSTGGVWTNNATTLYQTTYNPFTGIAIAKTVTLTAGDVLEAGAIDGSNTIFLPNFTSGTLYQYSTTGNTTIILAPCYAAGGSKNCDALPAFHTPQNVRVDSTGALWVSDPGTGRVVQVLGVASPTWPSLAYGHPGVKP
ncbi:MAG: hypothetical protein V4555_02780 [Acidobacteriota bacterium]